ncbi:hypothetical protein BV25DRAFT_1830710 [Artomyces pyxidatus]|uniref:Uncharacterized protein n=1 Tax=Artomyces pyxidatus TaxID=48021 RepID=A0ACB8SN41_9AGAM|nr:hypothetical protein BV25DRAFT_1830710 [Artomyces pyxidatus]
MQFPITALFAFAVSVASALPFHPVSDIVVSPSVTSPVAGAVWNIGTHQTVTWDTSAIPAANVNNTGLILLGYTTANSTSENLDINNPLASGFPIGQGSQVVTVPKVAPGTEYFVVLFGDSGNKSPAFKIAPATALTPATD